MYVSLFFYFASRPFVSSRFLIPSLDSVKEDFNKPMKKARRQDLIPDELKEKGTGIVGTSSFLTSLFLFFLSPEALFVHSVHTALYLSLYSHIYALPALCRHVIGGGEREGGKRGPLSFRGRVVRKLLISPRRHNRIYPPHFSEKICGKSVEQYADSWSPAILEAISHCCLADELWRFYLSSPYSLVPFCFIVRCCVPCV